VKKAVEKKKRTIITKEGSSSEPTNRRGKTHRKSLQKTIKHKTKISIKNNLCRRIEIKFKWREVSLPIKYSNI